jgi:lipoic acid synthetase
MLVGDLGRAGYTPTLELQQRLVAKVQADGEPSYVLLVEHDPPVITLGRRAGMRHVLADPEHLAAAGVEIVKVSRGGDVTWHGTGQLVAYPILRLDTRGLTLRAYVQCLEQAVINALAALGIAAQRRDGLVGVWVGQEKIAAIGVAVSRWVTYHGLSLNVSADLGGFDMIVPCGIAGAAVTSVSRLLGRDVSVEEIKPVLLECLAKSLGFEGIREDCGSRIADCGLPQGRRLALAEPLAGMEGPGGKACSSCTPSPSESEESKPPITGDGSANVKDPPGGNPQSAIRNPQSATRLPRWLRKSIPAGADAAQVRRLLNRLELSTVCSSARCPNQAECFARKTATFMILGDHCTRRCRFCAVPDGEPSPVNDAEAKAVAEAAAALGLRHVVITSVTRDDLPDGGAGHFAQVTLAVRRRLPGSVIEILIPDFQGDEQALATALAGGCDILNHNVETVPRLYPAVRPQADYRRSLRILDAARRLGAAAQSGAAEAADPVDAVDAVGKRLWTKSGLMLGLGEMREELPEVFADLRAAGCDILTIGQYLAPSSRHHPVVRFIPPEEFDEIRGQALALGFAAVAAGPFVRSSYHAEEVFNAGRIGESSPKG